jgi:predicted ATPase
MPPSLGIGGENAGKILATDYARRGGVLLRQVNGVLARDLPGWTLDISEQLNQYSIILRSNEDPALNVNLVDAGTGVAQVLPVFVQRALDILTPPERPVLEIMEQPELHLHPAAHGGLADLYLSASSEEKAKVKFLIETHSETLLLRVRRRIAEGVIPPDHVALYFVEHERGHATARQINIGPDGDLDYWPDGVFSEDYEEARALASAQLKRGDQGAR